MDTDVLYNGQRLRLTRFWGNQKPCLWITDPGQRNLSKMQFVGGYPNEYCIFLDTLTPAKMENITSVDGTQLDLRSLLEDSSPQTRDSYNENNNQNE